MAVFRSSNILANYNFPLIAALYAMKIFAFILTIVSFSCFAEVDLVKVDKSENKMYLLDNDKIIKEYHVAFGGSPKGHKEQEGDQKTPEGLYTLDYKKEDSSFYRAMHVSYPNKADLENAKRKGVSAGGFIMVHGQKNRFGWLSSITQQFNWTNGCIALTNKEMDEFMSLVKVGTKIQIEW
ncbi:L,D-transpeptidase family protein [Thalassotalea sp. PLHSN55]|uniref:L,D-transpeptidase family protein n=1 Tax=Thalassotalea sp. PLHSN55 TaxID=3435888 RepID=UPI003F864640